MSKLRRSYDAVKTLGMRDDKIEDIFTVIDCFKILATNKKKTDFKNFDHSFTIRITERMTKSNRTQISNILD